MKKLIAILKQPRTWLLALAAASSLGLGVSPEARTLIVTIGPQLVDLITAPAGSEPDEPN
jgi:hypothetical protein